MVETSRNLSPELHPHTVMSPPETEASLGEECRTTTTNETTEHRDTPASESNNYSSPTEMAQKTDTDRLLEQIEKEVKKSPISFTKRYECVGRLMDALSKPGVSAERVRAIVKSDPELLHVKQHPSGHTALHVLCQRPMPDHQGIGAIHWIGLLECDITNYKQLIEVVARHHLGACVEIDSHGDLPVHLAARTLMEWEVSWFNSINAEASAENDDNGVYTKAISKLYQTMSECIELLLKPLCSSPRRCSESGSVGEILPLHIAVIFTSTVPTLRAILESNPQAAGIPFKINNKLRTFAPNNAIAFQLHKELSTDFPQWETLSNNEDRQGPASTCQQSSTKKSLKRSDILLAYSPLPAVEFTTVIEVMKDEVHKHVEDLVVDELPTESDCDSKEEIKNLIRSFSSYDAVKMIQDSVVEFLMTAGGGVITSLLTDRQKVITFIDTCNESYALPKAFKRTQDLYECLRKECTEGAVRLWVKANLTESLRHVAEQAMVASQQVGNIQVMLDPATRQQDYSGCLDPLVVRQDFKIFSEEENQPNAYQVAECMPASAFTL